MRNRNRSMRGEFMIISPEHTKSFVQHARYSSHFCMEKPKGCEIVVVAQFRTAKKYIHADQYWFDVTNKKQWKRRSTTDVYGSGTSVFTWPHYDYDEYSVSSPEWLAYLTGRHIGKQPDGPAFAPGCNDQTYLEPDKEEKRICKLFFINRVEICPLCGISRASKAPEIPLSWSHYELWNMAMGESLYRLENFNDRWNDLLRFQDNHKLYQDPHVYCRCNRCKEQKMGFRQAWKKRYERVISDVPAWQRRSRPHLQAEDKAKEHIRAMWPDDYSDPPANLIKVIFRQAKKRARIKPLSRGEIAFFSMHLAATQMKQLKAMQN